MADRNLRLVAILKVALPLGALVLLSTVFLISRGIDPERAVAMSPVDIESLVREPRITDARFAGVTDDGAALTVLADTTRADPDGGLRLELDGVTGTLETLDNRITAFAARAGLLDQVVNLLRMEGDVDFQTQDGHMLSMDTLTAALDRTTVEGRGNIRGQAPAGTITAREMTLRETAPGSGSYVLVFSGDVKLIYTP